MEQVKIMPRHLLLILFPVVTAVLGGMLFSGNLAAFIGSAGGRGISQAQLYLGLSLLVGSMAFGYRCLTPAFRWAIVIFLPLVFSLVTLPQLSKNTSLSFIYALNLVLTVGLWFALRFIFFSREMIKVRTAVFALFAALLLTLYFRLLFMVLGMPFVTSQWSGYYWNSLFLFIFTGFGLSLADVAILRKEISYKPAEDIGDESEDDSQDA